MPRKSKKPVRKQTHSPTGKVVGQVGQILLPMIAGIAATKADLTEWVYEQIGTTRRECLDFLIPLSEEHLRRLLSEWRDYYNRARPHSSLGPGLPTPCVELPMKPDQHRHQLPAQRAVAFEAGPWWAPSRLPVVTRRLTDLASRGEQSVLSQARYCVGGPAATECRTSTEAKTSSQDLNSHGCLPVNSRSSFFADHNPRPRATSVVDRRV